MDGKSLDIKNEKIEQLKELLPEAFSEGKVDWEKLKAVACDLKAIYKAVTEEEGERALSAFEGKWDKNYPLIGKSWRNNWTRIIPFFAFLEAGEFKS